MLKSFWINYNFINIIKKVYFYNLYNEKVCFLKKLNVIIIFKMNEFYCFNLLLSYNFNITLNLLFLLLLSVSMDIESDFEFLEESFNEF